MSNPQLQIINETIDAGGTLRLRGLEMDFLASYEQSEGELRVKINGDGDFAWFNRGFFYHRGDANDVIHMVELKNEGAAAVTVKAVLGVGQWIDHRIAMVAPSFEGVADVSVPTGATTLLLAEDVRRVEVLVSNLNANTDPIRIADSAAGANTGVELLPGQGIILATSAAIYCRHAAAGAQSVGLSVTLR